jgi:hypothetical protein
MRPVIALAFLLLAPLARADETEITFRGQGGIVLSGTLTTPDGVIGKVPAMLLLPGSGPTDRDGNQLMANLRTDLLKGVAEGLAAAGIASLRFDKRAHMRYQKVWPKKISDMADFFDYDKFVADAGASHNFKRGGDGFSGAFVPELNPAIVSFLRKNL